MISKLKALITPAAEELHLYWNLRQSAETYPAVMMHFDAQLPTFPELGEHATYAEVLGAINRRGAWLMSLGMASNTHTAVLSVLRDYRARYQHGHRRGHP